MFSAATRDERLAAHVDAFAARLIGPSEFLSPAALARAVRKNLARSRAGADPGLSAA
jgi:hypothetical protein